MHHFILSNFCGLNRKKATTIVACFIALIVLSFGNSSVASAKSQHSITSQSQKITVLAQKTPFVSPLLVDCNMDPVVTGGKGYADWSTVVVCTQTYYRIDIGLDVQKNTSSGWINVQQGDKECSNCRSLTSSGRYYTSTGTYVRTLNSWGITRYDGTGAGLGGIVGGPTRVG